METQIFETIEVIAHFHNMKVEILRFKWKNNIYNVSALNSRWKIPAGNGYIFHYTVYCKKQNVICELAYNMDDFKWELVQLENL